MQVFLLLLSVFGFILQSDLSFALGSVCDKCHANFAGVVSGSSASSANFCTQCHSAGIGGNTGQTDSTPFVYQTNSSDLAGGNFYYAASKGDRYGHNVQGFAEINADSLNAPGLKDTSLDFRTTRLTCAGKYGCHGDRSKTSPRDSMNGSHHAYDPNKVPDGKTVATSYRFLLGVTGREMNLDGYKWEFKVSSQKHNGYKGSNNADDPGSISHLCMHCHGKEGSFHGLGGHPVNIILPMGEYEGYTEYDPSVPVARVDFSNVENEAEVSSKSGNDVVMCLSCHRAHGSPYASILRFPYDEENMSISGNCRTCHRNHK